MTTLAYSHTLVAGTPENINDVQDMFNDAKTVINGNLDATNLATSAKPVTLMGAYETVGETPSCVCSSAFITGAGTFYFTPDGFQPSGSTTTVAPFAIPITLADYAISGLTTQFRVKAVMLPNATAQAVNFTYGLHLIASLGGGAGVITPTLNAAVASSTVTRTAPAASTTFIDASSDFTLAADGVYFLAVTASGAPAVNSRSAIAMKLQVHHV